MLHILGDASFHASFLCFTRQWSFNPHFRIHISTSTSFESIPFHSHLRASDRVRFKRARASNGRSRARLLLFSFPFLLLLRASRSSTTKERSWRRVSIPQNFRANITKRILTPKTTMSRLLIHIDTTCIRHNTSNKGTSYI